MKVLPMWDVTTYDGILKFNDGCGNEIKNNFNDLSNVFVGVSLHSFWHDQIFYFIFKSFSIGNLKQTNKEQI